MAAAVAQALVKYDRLLGFACGLGVDARRGSRRCSSSLRGRDATSCPRLARIDDPDERLGTTYSMPDWIVEVVRGEVGEAATRAALRAHERARPARGARQHAEDDARGVRWPPWPRRASRRRPTRHAAQGLVLEGRRSMFRTQAFARGELEAQDEASQLVAELVAPPPRSFAVDACAGAGGKTLALAALLGGKGKLLALDASAGKLDELRRRARRAGASNVEARTVDLLEPGRSAATSSRGGPPASWSTRRAPGSGPSAATPRPAGG